MDISILETLNRRASLTALGALAAAALATVEPLTAAGKNSSRKKSRQRCKKDTAACLATLRTACAEVSDVEACVTSLTPCCETCSANGFFECYLNTIVAVP